MPILIASRVRIGILTFEDKSGNLQPCLLPFVARRCYESKGSPALARKL